MYSYCVNDLEIDLSLEDNGLLMESSKGRKLYCYSALSNIVNTDDHYFIFISRPEAIIIPKASIDSKDLVSFIAFLEKERLVALK